MLYTDNKFIISILKAGRFQSIKALFGVLSKGLIESVVDDHTYHWTNTSPSPRSIISRALIKRTQNTVGKYL